MSEIVTVERPSLLPLPALPIHIRPGTLADIPFIDGLQKKHSKQVGWMPTKTLEGKVALGHVLVAEEGVDSGKLIVDRKGVPSPLSTIHSQLSTPLGYCIGNDRYFKRDDVGIIYQMNVVPGRQRGLIGASLLKAQFERSAWGCKLYCCWCAQDIAANKFWEAMGFVPLAFRTGGRGKTVSGQVGESERREAHSTRRLTASPSHRGPRVHIFWQKRIRAGDTSTPWWFPSQTGGGSIREDRLVLPIPPGTKWSDEMPRILPTAGVPGDRESRRANFELQKAETKALPGATAVVERKARVRSTAAEASSNSQFAIGNSRSSPSLRPLGGVSFGLPKPATPAKAGKPPRAKRERQPAVKNDPRAVAAARELKDRYLDGINAVPDALATTNAKYDVGRMIEARATVEIIDAPRSIAA